MTNAFVTIVVPAERVEIARNLAACIAPGGHGMWTTGLSSDGAAPATHYISSGVVQSQFAGLLADTAAAFVAAQAGAAAQGTTLTASLADCEALMFASDISDEPPFAVMMRLGLQVILMNE